MVQKLGNICDMMKPMSTENPYQPCARSGATAFALRHGVRMAASFRFEMVQTDHGPEFITWFTHALLATKIAHRHSRVRQANDNAHEERFNRALQEECLDHTPHSFGTFQKVLPEYLKYYNTERLHIGLGYKTPLEFFQGLELN